ncbi:hypothetical protein ACMHYJ_08980 [Castellaniella hirudinis]|uniref:hypothetical protein n=1 Tax=Castellaniella hirudinis TaxID=1144617 RepID=UPI0039C4E2F6
MNTTALRIALAGALAATGLPAHADDAISCRLENGKTLALSELGTQPRYTYGKPGQPELALPAGKAKQQVYKGRAMFSGGGATYLRFTNGPYSYVAYSGIGKGWEFTGLIVYKADKVIMASRCAYSDFPLDSDAIHAAEDPDEQFSFPPE